MTSFLYIMILSFNVKKQKIYFSQIESDREKEEGQGGGEKEGTTLRKTDDEMAHT